jgi:hypothetical protein
LRNVFPKRLQLHHGIHSTTTATTGAGAVPNTRVVLYSVNERAHRLGYEGVWISLVT